MKVGYFQFNPKFLDIDHNLNKIEDMISGSDTELLVLPEFFNSGYAFNSIDEVKSAAESIPNGRTTDFLINIAKKENMYITAGLPETDNDQYYNSSVLVGPKGYIGKYRKVHLFYKEKLFFKRGNLGYPIFNIEDVKVGMLICFDWFFPEAMRALALNGAQIILHPTNLVMSYYQEASKVRALENRVFIVLSNRFGDEGDYHFTGRSQIVDPQGKILINSGENIEEIRSIEIDPKLACNKKLNEFNDLFMDI
ncbi:acyltransferase [bacterium]|nr:acyltransferase [bacterium]